MATLTLTIETTGETSTIQTTDAKAQTIIHAVLGSERWRTVVDPVTGEESQVELTTQEKIDLFMPKVRGFVLVEARRNHVQAAEVDAKATAQPIRDQARQEARGFEF